MYTVIGADQVFYNFNEKKKGKQYGIWHDLQIEIRQ